MKPHIPPLGYHWLTPLYDPVHQVLGWSRAYTGVLIEQLRLEAGQRLLDLGCGTATLTLRIKQHYPAALVVGLDVDALALDLARRKALSQNVAVGLQRALASELPYADASFDRVVSTLMLHHLDAEEKHRALREVLRVLLPGGACWIIEFGQPQVPQAGALARLARHLEHIGAQVDGLIPLLLAEAGFAPVEEHGHYVLGFLTLYYARKPGRVRGW